MKKVLLFALMASSTTFMSACVERDAEDPGKEYAPDMYESVAYEPYKQVDENKVNPNGQNMRMPVSRTIPRVKGAEGGLSLELMPDYPISKDSLAYAAAVLRNPIAKTEQVMKDGKYLYTTYCSPCHGAEGDGKGLVGEKYAGVPNYKASNIANQPSGHIYHVITKGKGRMWPHGSQIRPEDRWKIVHYVNELRGYTDPNQN